MQNYKKQPIVMVIGIGIISTLCFYKLARTQDALPHENPCLSCHEKVNESLPVNVHKPFEEKKCYDCHKFQFKSGTSHRYVFLQSLVPENTYYFRLRGFRPDISSSHISQIYSFITPSQGGVAIHFPDANEFHQIELVTDSWDSSTAVLTWQSEYPEYSVIDHGTVASLAQSSREHAEEADSLAGIGIDACYQCHPKNSLGVSHPVNVLPSFKMKEKMAHANLPTGKNGLLLCITCHLPHAGNEKYLGRKVVTEELCVACHPKEIYNP